MPGNKRTTIAICGFGLIGGSMALDLQRSRRSTAIYAWDKPSVLARLKHDKRFRIKSERTFAATVAGRDIIILSASHRANEMLLRRLARMKTVDNALILDTGAVKQPIVRVANMLNLHGSTQFLPSHPMAGREKKGFASAAKGLFAEHAWCFDDQVTLNNVNKARLDWLVRSLKATPFEVDAAQHDEIMAEISHLPQLVSTLLGAQVNANLIPLAGPGLKSMLRLAGSPWEVWSEIVAENRQEIVQSLRLFERNLRHVTKLIENEQSLSDIFAAAARSYRCL
ncbi:MAG: prephenate dehydrogenase [Candidatus Zixiibacteriota bacterium]